MTDKEKIRTEIERLKAEQLAIFSKGEDEDSCGDALTHIGAYNQLLSFIYSLKTEHTPQDLEEAAYRYCFDLAGFPEDLYGNELTDNLQFNYNDLQKAFKAGTQWQLSQFPKWKRFLNDACWSGEIGVKPNKRKFTYEHYAINADKLFRLLPKED